MHRVISDKYYSFLFEIKENFKACLVPNQNNPLRRFSFFLSPPLPSPLPSLTEQFR